jgi:hypothetical protein
MFRHASPTIVVCGFLVLAVTPGKAQLTDSFENAFPDVPAVLTWRPDVRKELNLGPEQEAELQRGLQPIKVEYDKKLKNLGKLNPVEAAKERAALRQQALERSGKVVQEILDAGQWKRLRQIALHVRGVEALRDADVQKELGFTEAQQKKIEALAEELKRALARLRLEAVGTFPESRLTPRFLQNDHAVKARGVLTRQQADRWREMLGEPFPRLLKKG